jgi:hypothetical protein
LALHILSPFIQAVILVAIALDRQTRVIVPVNDHVDAILANLHLGRHPIATFCEFVVHFTFKRGFTEFSEVFHPNFILPEGHSEVVNEAPPVNVRFA